MGQRGLARVIAAGRVGATGSGRLELRGFLSPNGHGGGKAILSSGTAFSSAKSQIV